MPTLLVVRPTMQKYEIWLNPTGVDAGGLCKTTFAHSKCFAFANFVDTLPSSSSARPSDYTVREAEMDRMDTTFVQIVEILELTTVIPVSIPVYSPAEAIWYAEAFEDYFFRSGDPITAMIRLRFEYHQS